MAKRNSRKNIKEDDIDLLVPVDITLLGSDEDPCFGKLHDLKAPECMECGDADFCALVKAQNLHKKRLVIENNQRFKDIEEADQILANTKEKIKKDIEEAKKSGAKRLKTILRLSEKYGISKDIIKQLYI